MRKAKTLEEQADTRWRKRAFKQDVFYFDTVDAVLTRDENGEEKVQLDNTHFMTLDQWREHGDRYCVDAGLDWFIDNVQEKINKVLEEMAAYEG